MAKIGKAVKKFPSHFRGVKYWLFLRVPDIRIYINPSCRDKVF